MENNNETIENMAAAIIAGLYICDQPKAIKLLENIDKVIYIEGKGHYKKIYYDDLTTDMIKINCNDLELLLPPGKLSKEHESFWVNFDHVTYACRVGRDTKARMSNNDLVKIGRDKAKMFKEKCKKAGKVMDIILKRDNT